MHFIFVILVSCACFQCTDCVSLTVFLKYIFRGPSGIQLMSNPGSPTPRGRGRGRWKEMSSNERVTNWVNQREAKRLNKERWANHATGAHSSTGDADVQMPTKQEAVEPETSLDRYVLLEAQTCTNTQKPDNRMYPV